MPTGYYFQSQPPVYFWMLGTLGWYQEVGIDADPIEVRSKIRGSISHFPPAIRNRDLDLLYDCSILTDAGVPRGVIRLTASVSGSNLNLTHIPAPIEVTTTVLGTLIPGMTSGFIGPIALSITLSSVEIHTTPTKQNWVKWANIGSVDFTIGKDNIAGERPVNWKGWVYDVKKLGNKAMVYGQNGISMLIPSANLYGLVGVHSIGLKGRQAIAGNDRVHYFVDNSGQLYKISESPTKSALLETSTYPERLGYSEYLSSMLNLVLTLDEKNNLLYICDGIDGYVYSEDTKSFGKGPHNITGLGYQNGEQYLVAAGSAVADIPLLLCTDICDFGTRKYKTISSFTVGADTSADLYGAVDYRMHKDDDFITLDWIKMNPEGRVVQPCYGVEFRFRVKSLVRAYLEIDYLNVEGQIHDYSFLDSIQLRREL